MARFVRIPPERLNAEVLQAMLEDYASRDGTDYGRREMALDEKTVRLRRQLAGGKLVLVHDLDSEHWDLVDARRLGEFNL